MGNSDRMGKQVRYPRRLPCVGKLLLVGALALLMATGCGPQQAPAPTEPGQSPGAPAAKPTPGGILDLAFAVAEPAHLDPLRSTSYAFTNLTGKAYNGLVQYDPIENTKIVPELAQRWEVSSDGKTITFFLHRGVRWHDGVPFSAADVKYTLDRLRDPKDPDATDFSGKRVYLSYVERVELVDDNTVRLALSRPSNSLLGALAYGSMVVAPKHAQEKGIDLGKTVLGTGGFKLSNYQRGAVFQVVKNPDYFIKDRPYLDGINIYLLKDNATRVAAFTTGQIRMLGYIYKPDVDQIKQSVPQAVISTKSGLRNGFLGFQNDKPPFTDVRVRRAIHLTLDRQAALNVLAPGEGTTGTLLDPAISGFTPEELGKLPAYRQDKAQDLTEARKLLGEAGYPSGFKTSILTSAASQDYADLAVYVKDQLRKLGIDATINAVPQADYTATRSQGNFEMAAVVGVLNFADPSGGSSYYGLENFMQFKDARFQELYAAQDAVLSEAERKKLVRQMEERWLDQSPYTMLYWKTHSAAMYPEVRGYEIGVGIYNTHRFQDVWLAQQK